MRISTKDWKNYIEKLSKLNNTAGEKMSDYVARHGFNDPNIIDYAYGLVTKYGEGSASLSAMMYDAIAEMEGKILPSAEVAETPEYGEVAKAINGVKKHSQNPNSYGNVVNRLVKRTGADTMLKNADRDGAEFAWVPSGDTCAFCIALASRGWQHISKKSLKNGHAEHIHANCDCNYTVRFDGKSTVEGYDPDEYLEIYENAEGSTPDEKIKYIRRKINTAKKAKASQDSKLIWPESGEKISLNEFKEIRKFAEENNIILRGVKNSDLDKELVVETISSVNRILDKYNIRENIDYPFELDFSHSLLDNDFAQTFEGTKHIIYFNKKAYRNKNALINNYNINSESGYFVKGTNYKAIPYHELGHIIQDVYNIDPMSIAKEITGLEENAEVIEKVIKDLSKYSGKDLDGSEIIAECFAAVENGVKNDFALKFVDKCVNIIKRR